MPNVLATLAALVLGALSVAAQDRAGFTQDRIGVAQDPVGQAGRDRPNILLVLIDDVGLEQLRVYSDVNQYEGDYPYAHTPTIDRLAAEGVRFTQCRVQPLCSAARVAILTGRYPFRTGIGSLIAPERASSSARGLGDPEPEPTIAHRLRAAGYTTALIGKAHVELAWPAMGAPDPIGFDHRAGTLQNISGTEDNPPVGKLRPGFWNFVWMEEGRAAQVTDVYVTHYTRQKAQDWIERSAQAPWFLCLSFNACHRAAFSSSWPPPMTGSGPQHGFGQRPEGMQWNTFLRASLETLDTQLGLFLDWLSVEHPNTVVLFMADNGTTGHSLNARGNMRYPRGHPSWRAGDHKRGFSMAPYDDDRGKATVYEGGIRVPLLVGGPGIAAGLVSDALVDGVDLHATILALAGLAPAESGAEDSISFLGSLSGAPDGTERAHSFSEMFKPNTKSGAERTSFQWSFITRRDGGLWKVVRSSEAEGPELYDLSSDPLERSDLGPEHPVFSELRGDLNRLLGEAGYPPASTR